MRISDWSSECALPIWDQSGDKLPELKVYGPPFIERMTELLISEDGVFGPDIEARTKHQLSIDTFEWPGGVAPRKRPNPEVHEVRSGQPVQGDGWKGTTRGGINGQPYHPRRGPSRGRGVWKEK